MMTLVAVLALAATPMTLEEARAASRANLEAVRAELDVRTAGLAKTSAASSIYPQVSLTAGASGFWAGPQRIFSTVPTPASDGTITFEQRSVDVPSSTRGNFALGVSVSQLLYDGGRWWTQIAQAGKQEEAAQGKLDEQRLASELEAVRRFYELVRAQLSLQVLQSSVQRSEDQVTRAKSLFEAGRGQRRDVLDAQVNLGNDRISVLRQQQGIVSAQVELLQWLGKPNDEIEAVVPVVMSAPPRAGVPSVDDAISLARAKRPLFKSLDAQAEAQALSVELARADYFPRVGVNVGYQRSSPSADPFFTDLTKQNGLSAGLNLSWDLFSGFQTDATVARARADLSNLDAQQKQALVDLQGEVRRGVRALQTLLSVAEIAEANRSLAEQELQVEVERFAAGAGSSIDVRNAQVKVTQAQLTQLQGRIDVEVARAALARIAGAPVENSP